MNYIKELNAFYEWLDTNPLSSGAIVLWYTLMAINNKTNWLDEFTVANMALQAKTGLSRQQLTRARTDLINAGRIKYKKSGRANRAGSYMIVSFNTQSDTHEIHRTDTEQHTSDTQDEHKVTTLVKHKLNETKRNKDNSRKQVYDEDSVHFKLALRLYERILENNPYHKKPNLQKWADDVRLMMECDNRTEEQISFLIDWCQQDSFWKSNVLSIRKLREQFDRLVIRVKEENNKNAVNDKMPLAYQSLQDWADEA